MTASLSHSKAGAGGVDGVEGQGDLNQFLAA